MKMLPFFSVLLCLSLFMPITRADGVRLENFDYPFEAKVFSFESQQQPLEMIYMDVPAAGGTKGTIVLLHGKNFSGAYWESTANALSKEGFRVIMPDQIGFGKSSKPEHYQFSFHQLATNTRALLAELGIENSFILGHSMGGMLATRYALMFPENTSGLILENPIGLEDWLQKGVPYTPLDTAYQSELKKTIQGIRAYQLKFYYDNQWKEAYDPWVELLGQFIASDEYPRMAWNQALTFDMIITQPVVHQFKDLKVPTLLIIGQRDRTAIGRAAASPELAARLGDYPKLGRATQAAIPDAELVEIEGIGHLPHIEDFPRFITPLQKFLSARTSPQE
ncbi:alpha/beta hydrolase [Kiritimatiellaeota bacterium B1221]|nr:alpha/beta hydrolase [Kiritimatiellaeota bacterium B1221]